MAEKKNFVGYEYKTVKVPREQESLWTDSMKNFGWALNRSEPATVKHVWGPLRVILASLALIPGTPFKKMMLDHDSETEVEITFKRDKHIAGKEDLTRLQLQFESYARGIETLEDSKTFGAKAGAYTTALLGTILMAVSMFAYLAGSIPLMVVLAVPGFLGWILPYFIFQRMKGKKTEAIEPKIEEQHDGIHGVCQQANGVLARA